MIDAPYELKVLKNNEANLKLLITIGEKEASKEYHILMNKKKLALITHLVWDKCDYCNATCDEKGIINLT